MFVTSCHSFLTSAMQEGVFRVGGARNGKVEHKSCLKGAASDKYMDAGRGVLS